MTERIARAAARHPWLTVLAWLGTFVVALGIVVTLLGGGLTTEGANTNNPESEQADAILAARIPPHNETTELAVLRSDRYTVDEPAFRAQVERLAGQARRYIEHAELYYERRDRSLVSPDRHALLVPIRLAGDEEQSIERLLEIVERENGREGWQVAITGEFTSDHDFNEVSQHDLKSGELKFGLPSALVVLVLVFGTLVAAGLPLLLALVSIVVALGLTALVAQQWELSIFVVNMLSGMGFALGIDYALFIVSRFREERTAGRENLAAIATTGATASRAVLFSGTAFVLAMLGLLLVQSTIMRSLALGAILVAIVSVVAALTLLPAVLRLVGDRVNALRVPLLGRAIERGAGREGRFWSAVVRAVQRRPALSLAAAVALLLVAATPLVTMNIGAAGISTLPDSLASKQGFLALERSFPAAGADPAVVVVDGNADAPDVKGAIRRLRQRLARDDDFGDVSLQVGPRRDVAVLRVQVSADALSDRAVDAVRRLRSDYIPEAFAGIQARVLVTGTTAENVDYFHVMTKWLPIVFAFVLGLSFLLLTAAFRSLVVAATAIVLNLVSIGATYGLVVLVFQHGVGTDLLGFQQVETIEAWVPLFLFAVLFGLSMDYQVFLLSRIRERYSRTHDNRDAVAFGIGSTARLITGAALIIVAVFIGFAMGDLVMFQQMGFGIAVALLIDATIVRSVLVPAAMQLLGERNWYLPRWLEWLPHVEVEREAPQAAAASQPG